MESGSGVQREPSVAVLPFRSLSPGSDPKLAADGLTEDLVEAVSRAPGVFVVSRLSTSAFKSQDRSPQEIGAALGVRYILSGSVRFLDERLRVIVELTEADTAKVIWLSQLDDNRSDLLELQNSLAQRVAISISPRLRSAELKRIKIKRPEDYNAYDLFLRAQENMHDPSREIFDSAGQLLNAAIAREADYATAIAWLAHWHVLRVGQGWSSNTTYDSDQAEYFAQRAIDCDPSEALAYAVQGHVAAYLRKEFDQAFECFETALQLNPNSARAWLWNANAHAYVGEGRLAVEKVKKAMALSPFDPLMYAYSCSANLAYMADGKYERAVEFGLRCIRQNPGYTSGYRMLIPALIMAGKRDEAQARAHQLLTLQPSLTVERFRRRFPGSASPLGELCCDALAQAGIPYSN